MEIVNNQFLQIRQHQASTINTLDVLMNDMHGLREEVGKVKVEKHLELEEVEVEDEAAEEIHSLVCSKKRKKKFKQEYKKHREFVKNNLYNI